MTVPAYIHSNAHALSVNVIGAGGTGSLLLQHLARIHTTLQAQGKKGLMVTCIDGDIVEEHNRGRQLYTLGDIGRHKSVVMIERINRFYGTCWDAIPRMFDRTMWDQDCMPGNIIISCTDTVASRKEVDMYLKDVSIMNTREEHANHYWIDTGNGRYTGQIIMGSEKHRLPSSVDMFPGMLKDEKKSKAASCSLAEAVAEQDLMVNPMVALVASELVWNITQLKRLQWTAAFINLKKKLPLKYQYYGRMDR